MPSTPPPSVGYEYQQKKRGYFGRLGGSPTNPSVRYLQTGFSINEIHKLTLVADIPGSNSWPIRELFQRDIDQDRVHREILPYLGHAGSFRFFNPLTIAVLPVERDQRVVTSKIAGGEVEVIDHDRRFVRAEVRGYYQLDQCVENPEYSKLSWDESRVKLVAIDGQHRLSALKRASARMMAEAAAHDDRAAADWTVPVILVALPELHWHPEEYKQSILEAVRAIFTRVNMTAKKIDDSRAILLDDVKPVAVAVQQVLQECHAHPSSFLPLTMFEWRGDQSRPQVSSILSAAELALCLENFVLGKDVDAWSKSLEFLSDETPDRLTVPTDFRVLQQDSETSWVLGSPSAAQRFRARFRATIQPGLVHLLREVNCLRTYREALMALEDEYTSSQSDLDVHALDRLRFGHSKEDSVLSEQVALRYKMLVERVLGEKEHIPDLLRMDIGIRSIFSAFGRMRDVYSAFLGSTVDWLPYAKWFTELLNQCIDTGLFARGQQHLLYACVDPLTDAVTNYREDRVQKGLGALVALRSVSGDENLVSWLRAQPGETPVDRIIDDYYNTVVAGMTRCFRVELKEQYPDNSRARNAAAKKRAAAEAPRFVKDVLRAELFQLSEGASLTRSSKSRRKR